MARTSNVSIAAFSLSRSRPTYRLSIGLPGASNALAIASNLGMPADVIEAARGTLGQPVRRPVPDALLRHQARIGDARVVTVVLQDESEDAYRGRVMSVHTTIVICT